jgi:putative type II/III system pilus formation protein
LHFIHHLVSHFIHHFIGKLDRRPSGAAARIAVGGSTQRVRRAPMTVLFAYRRSASQALAAIVLLLAAVASTPARAIDTITVALDQATITKMPDSVSTLVIGNPVIADVTVRPGGLLVVTGKAYGVTNLIVLDGSGAVLSERYIEVTGPRDELVVVYRGVNRESYSCAPDCQPRIVLGDAPQFFSQTAGQTGERTTQALGQAAIGAVTGR